MLWIDTKYAGLISSSLPLFKVKQNNPYMANFRCPICGDSKKSKFKARGYLFTKKNELFYKCHNCGVGSSFGKLLKHVNQSLYDQYTLERYKEGLDIGRQAKPHSKQTFKFEEPKFKKKNILDKHLQRLDKLPDTNRAVQYCVKRNIPKIRWKELYYVDNVQKLEEIHPQYKDKVLGEEDRLVIPFFSKGNLVGITCRALGNESLRYLTLRVDNDSPLIYNIDNVDNSRIVHVTEGPIDSLFLDNSIAVGNSDLKKIGTLLSKDNIVLVFDNEPRNQELVKIISNATDDNYKVVVWPSNIKHKDINEMVLNNIDVKTIINKNTFTGLRLKVNFNQWKKI